VRSSRLDVGVLNINCRFALAGRDAGKTATVKAAIQNTDCATCRGWTSMTGDDGGGYIGLMLGRDNSTGAPTIETFADYNRRRYWANLKGIPASKKIASLFPILDTFDPDGDITTREEAFAAMHDKMGTSTPMGVLPPDWSGRTSGIPWGRADPGYAAHVLGVGGGFRKGSDTLYHNPANAEPCYSPNSSCTMHDYTMKNATDAGLVNASDIAKAVKATFGSTAVKPGTIVGSALADEPGWVMDKLWVPTDTSHIVQQRWVAYLQAQGMTPALLGANKWAAVQPYRTHPDGPTPLPLTERRRFYYTVRFIHWDSCRYMAEWTAALQAGAQDPTLQTYVNWNTFDGRVYVSSKEPFAAGTTAAMSYDWFEWARMKSGSMLWTEDWMPDASSHRWSYYSARMRSAIALSNRTGPEQEFAGYTVVGSSGAQAGGLLQRPLTMVGSGAKLVRYYNTGPEYMFPANSYSESANASRLMAEIAQANSMIAQAEHLLWTARRPPSTVAILYPRSSEMWDQFHISKYARDSSSLCLCCCVTSMVAHYIDYTAETYGLYLALATDSNIPVDFLDEDALEEPGTLAPYKLIWVTQPNVPAAGSAGLAAWVRQGGALVTVSGAGRSDAFDEPSTILSDLAGVREALRERIGVMSDTTLNPFAPRPTPVLPSAHGTATLAPGRAPLPFFAQGAVGNLTGSGDGAASLASFADGSRAITSKPNGKGRAVHFAWLPGLSYYFSSAPDTIGNRPRDESLRQIMRRYRHEPRRHCATSDGRSSSDRDAAAARPDQEDSGGDAAQLPGRAARACGASTPPQCHAPVQAHGRVLGRARGADAHQGAGGCGRWHRLGGELDAATRIWRLCAAELGAAEAGGDCVLCVWKPVLMNTHEGEYETRATLFDQRR
jgi:hypothetical protein